MTLANADSAKLSWSWTTTHQYGKCSPLLFSLIRSHAGWEVCGEAADGKEAVELAQQIKPDLIIMDLSMPGISGLVAASALRKIFPAVPIILFSLYASKLLEIDAAKVGVSAVLSKTAPLYTLIEKAHELMG